LGFYLVQFLTGLSDASALFLVSCGLSLIFGVSRIVNLAHGSFYMVGAYLAYYLIDFMPHGAISFWAGIVLATLIVGLVGVVLEIFLLRRLYSAPELFILFASFGVVLIIQDLSRWLFGAEDILGQQAPGLEGSVDVMGTLLPQYDIALIVIAPLILVGLWLLLNNTRWGVLVRAATEDREMSGALGVNQTWLFTAVFFLGSCLAGLGGAVQLPKGGANLLMDLNMIAAAFVIVVVGGMGSIPGAYLASVIIGELNSFGILVFPQSTLVLMFLSMAVVLIIRPHGLFGKAEVAEHGAAETAESILKPAPKKLKLLGLALLIFILVMPAFVNSYSLVLMTEIALFALVSMSLYFMMAGGMVSFGHAAFFGGGAYAAALMVHYLDSPMELAILLAPVFVGLLALIIGWFCVRLSGVYFAILTLAFAQICWSVVFQWGEFTGGDDGLLTIWPSDWASEKIVFYYLTMVLCIGGILLLRYFIFTPFGYTMRACRDSALRVDSIGINLRRHQWFAFTIAGIFAGLAGGIYVFSKGSVFPDEMAIPRSFEFLFMVLLGGVETLFGPVAGSAAYTWLHDKIARFDFWQLTIGCIFIFLVVAFPQGIAGSIHNRLGKYIEDGKDFRSA
jgi:branched-chain amino acid transport system permease protein